MLGIAVAIKRRNPQAFFDAFRLPSTRRRYGTVSKATSGFAKDAVDVALEIKFGWKPLIQDISDSIKVLGRDFPPLVLKASGESDYSWDTHEGDYHHRGSGSAGTGYVAHVVKVNPGTLLLNSLGLINPVATAYEVIPLSFILNWFIPVGKFLGSFTGTMGVSMNRISRSYRGRATGITAVVVGSQGSYVIMGDAIYFQRDYIDSIPVPSLKAQWGAHSVVKNLTDARDKLITIGQLVIQRRS
jgi:hypothetical protein